MRKRNWREIYTGLVLLIVAIGFFFFMMAIARASNDFETATHTAGAISGLAIAFGVFMIAKGLIGKS